MKKIIVLSALLFSAMSFAQNENAKNLGVFVEKSYTDLGKILDFRASLMKVKNLTTSAVENKLVIETKGFASNDVKNIELDKASAKEMITTMNQLKSTYFSKILTENTEISYTSSLGHEIGANFVVEKPSASAPSTKKEKYYIDTPEKYYEGKIVIRDATGTYIWKEVSATAVAVATGKWVPFIRLNNNSSKTIFNISVEDFNAFIKFLEDNSSKL